ncbi:MAG: FAD:protein FMN transferase [Clostridia bacterium]|nr:FAD:protein FMN transferase [Clostridia bacterium]
MRRMVCLLLCAVMLFGIAAAHAEERRTAVFYDCFDTVIMLTAYTDDEALFNEMASLCEAEFRRLDKLFQPYKLFEGVNNICFINKHAAEGPVAVEPELLELLRRSKEAQQAIPGTVNVAMGSVLKLWHDARTAAENEEAYVPPMEELQAAAVHTNMDDLMLDEENGTVYFADPLLQLDIGAVAKGYAAGLVAEKIAPRMPKFAINAGGNIITGDAPDNDIRLWKSGIQNPDNFYLSTDYLVTIGIKNKSLVTSGDYQRYYYVGDEKYHHIISPDTLMPARTCRAVTILEDDAFLADYLSTAAFLLPYEQGRQMIDAIPTAEALWVLADGTVYMTEGFEACRID